MFLTVFLTQKPRKGKTQVILNSEDNQFFYNELLNIPSMENSIGFLFDLNTLMFKKKKHLTATV